ncbi:hemin uptake protein HemP [Pelagimonas phthalicica]
MSEQSIQRLPIHDATKLTQGGSLANIQLGDQMYTLRITRAGKLILTK